MTDRPRPFREGKTAFTSGLSVDTNPYARGQTHVACVGDMHEEWVRGWQSAEMDDLLTKTPIPDLTLIAQAEILIPKGDYWCGHELNRTLHYYREACVKGVVTDIKISERSLRRAMVYARLEAAGLPVR